MTSFAYFAPPPPSSRLKIAPDCPHETDDIRAFLLRAHPASTTRQFAVGQFAGQCPPGTVETMALVKKGWHGERNFGDPWFTVELLFRGANK